MAAGGRPPHPGAADSGAPPIPRASVRGMLQRRESMEGAISRNELFAGLSVIGFANGISEAVARTVSEKGPVSALMSTFDISVLVWCACAIGIAFLLREPEQPARRSDWVVAACALAAFLVPVVPLSWLAISGLAIHILHQSPRSSFTHRGAWILLAMTVPMFWGRLVFAMLNDLILRGDAVLVGWLVGTPRIGNAILFPDGSGYLWIAPPCSSLANISLAILCWVMVAKFRDHPGSLRNVGWVLAACAAVVAINVSRISLIGLYPHHYDLIHGSIGSAVASWMILGATVGICLLGVRHGHRAAGA